MILQVTNEIRNGEIVLPTIGYAVKAGVKLTISDDKFYNNDIQAAIRKGFIAVVDKQGHEDSEYAKKIRVRNLSPRPLALDNISLLVGEEQYISEQEFQSTNVQTAINSGMIECQIPMKKGQPVPKFLEKHLDEVEQEDPQGEPESEEETDIPYSKPSAKARLAQIKKKEKTTPKTAKKSAPKTSPKTAPKKVVSEQSLLKRLQKEAAKIEVEQGDLSEEGPDIIDQDEQEELEAAQELIQIKKQLKEEKQNAVQTKMQAWNPHSKKMMDKAEASGKVCKVVSSRVTNKRSVNDDGIMVGDIDLTEKGVKTAKKVTNVKSGNKGKQGIKPVGRVRGAGDEGDGDDLIVDTSEDNDISFVDREQKVERLRARPDLMRRPTMRQNQEIE